MSSHFAAAFFLAKIAIRYIGGDKEKFLQRKERKKNNEKNQRLTESWSVRGHYRHYASGKTVYVKPYTKGSGKKAAKAYKLASNV